MNREKEITLNELLIAREERAKTQKRLIDTFKANLISFMVNIPGKNKDTSISRKLHNEGRHILKKKLEANNINIIYDEFHYHLTGAEAFILTDADAVKLKEILVNIEDTHPLGRLFDFDVIDKEFTMISRTFVNHKNRKCLLCEEDAAICVRSQKHSYEDLIKEVYLLAYEYFDKIQLVR